jgi:short-subunit dehydrogenase
MSFVDRYGPWALITGASDGIGAAFAGALAERGLNLVLVARRGELLHRLAGELEARWRVHTRVVVTDLTEAAAVDRLIESVGELPIGLLVAAAGFGTSGKVPSTDAVEELRMIDLNCRAAVALSEWLAPRLVSARRGGIVLMSSILAFQGVGRAATYSATKAFIQSFAEGLAADLRGTGIDVVASAPGPVRSGFGARAGMRITSGSTPEAVAAGTILGLGRRVTTRPDWRSKLLGWSLATLPRRMRSLVLGQLMKGMTRHHAEADAGNA